MAESRSVNYLMSGPPHLPYFVVSVYTLRQHWDGEINVHVWPESFDFLLEIAADLKYLNVFPREPVYRGKNSQFIDKIRVMMTNHTREGIYLDADTMVQRPIDGLFQENRSFVATQFNDWKSNEGLPRKRVERLIGREEIDQESVKIAITQPLPSVNGGVFACERDSPVLKKWLDWTLAVKDIFIADETVLHAIVADYDSTGLVRVIRGGSYNCSPRFKPKHAHDKQVRIWHFHGDCNCKIMDGGKFKSQKGYDIWWPVYQQCLRENVGNINDWKDRCGNKHLKRLEQSHAA